MGTFEVKGHSDGATDVSGTLREAIDIKGNSDMDN